MCNVYIAQHSRAILLFFVSALAHYHAAISINVNDADSTEDLTKEKFNNAKHMIELCDLANDENVSPCALKKAHIRESHACHEEAQRLQRMCRDLKVIIILIWICGLLPVG